MKKKAAFNKHQLFYLMMIVIMVLIAVRCFSDGELLIGFAFVIFALVGIFVASTSSICYRFTKESVTIVYWFGVQEEIRWREIREITLFGSWISHGGGLPHYAISYPHERKIFFMNGEIAKTRKTKKLIKMFYKQDIL